MTTASTIPGVIDAILQKATESTYTYNGKQLQVTVFDGFPGPNQPPVLIAVGGAVDPTVEGESEWAGLGSTVRYERYDVRCYVSAYIGGDGTQGVDPTSPRSTADAQRTARAQAFAVFKTLEAALRSDRELIQVATPPGIMWCEVWRVGLQQTTAEDAAPGRLATIEFAVHVRARLDAV